MLKGFVETKILQFFKWMYNSVLLSGLLFYIEFLKLLPKYLSTADVEQTLVEMSDCIELLIKMCKVYYEFHLLASVRDDFAA